MPRYTSVLDIGSSKVVCLICGKGSGGMVVHGVGVCEYSGYRAGEFTDASLPETRELSTAVKRAVSQAEHEAKVMLKSVAVGVGAPFLKTVIMRGEIISDSKPRTVSDADADRLIDISLKNTSQEGYELIHSTPVRFFAEDSESQNLPSGRGVYRLAGDISHVYLDVRMRDIITDVLEGLNLNIDAFVGVPLAEALFLIPPHHREVGTLLIDIGYTHTDISFAKNEALLYSCVIGAGGRHFASDIAYCLELQQNIAEGIKRRFVFGADCENNVESVKLADGNVRYVQESTVRDIVEARAEELADLIFEGAGEVIVAQRVQGDESSEVFFSEDESQADGKQPAYLTGGGLALMRGGSEFLSKCLGIPIDTSMPTVPRFNTQNYASVFAVANFVIDAGVHTDIAGKSGKQGFFKKLMGRI